MDDVLNTPQDIESDSQLIIPDEDVGDDEIDSGEVITQVTDEADNESIRTDDTIYRKATVGFENKEIPKKVRREDVWPPKDERYNSIFEEALFPPSYKENTLKEKRVIAYCENFQRQYSTLCTDRTQLFIIPRNEFNIPKFVCTAIRRTLLPYPEFYQWSECAKFVADFLELIPLRPYSEPPKRLYSPSVVIQRQMGTVFDFSNLLCSLLLGAGYDAYVVHGYASREICLKDLRCNTCPYLIKPKQEREPVKQRSVNKYSIKASKNLKSKYDIYVESTQQKADEEKRQKIEKQQEMLEEELDQPSFDPLYGLRVHSWVLVLSGKREVGEPFFIEPLTGLAVSVQSKNYLGIEAVWNDLNYWVCMQDCSKGISNVSYDLGDALLWEYLMPTGNSHNTILPPNIEPLTSQSAEWNKLQSTLDYGAEVVEEPEFDLPARKTQPNSHRRGPETVLKEKPDSKIRKLLLATPVDKAMLFDLPPSWTMPIVLELENFHKKYPKNMRQTHYKRAIETRFAEYYNSDGLVYQVEIFSDREYQYLDEVIKLYRNRADKLVEMRLDAKTDWIEEKFDRGVIRTHLKSHKYKVENQHNELRERIMTFYDEARVDGLKKREFQTDQMLEHYVGREDRLFFRKTVYLRPPDDRRGVKFAENKSVDVENTAIVLVTERFKRNPKVDADEDVFERTFNLTDNKTINLVYHLGKDRIVSSTRTFTKSPQALDRAQELKLVSDTHSYFTVDPQKNFKSNSEIYEMFLYFLKEEAKTLGVVRKSEIETRLILKQREKDALEPAFETHLFDTLRIEDAKEARFRAEQLAKEEALNTTEPELDFMMPYLQTMSLDGSDLNREVALKLREDCLNDFKTRLVNKANIIQSRFEQETETLRVKQQWYQLNQKHLKKKEEEEYMQYCRDAIFRIHTLETMINRHKQLAPQKYMGLEKKIRADPRMADLIN
ncbi:hypothetical protein Ciccas_001371 [Cichlidogyrus casuarinus]|uniref:Dynein regulatory complex subunit 7 n=1 Tax=Cichlidogyrus casuarinus TaxID=1844966 RepID=A0ABD2QK78_9PLAT